MSVRYTFHPVCAEDAPDLLNCYSDPAAVARMNSDNCRGTFLMQTLQDVQTAVAFWQNDPVIERLSIFSSEADCVIGTAEYHFNPQEKALVLRLDLCSSQETRECIAELMPLLCEEGFLRYPAARRAVIKAFPQDEERRSALQQCRFSAVADFAGFPYYFALPRPFRGIAVCGLACGYCSERFGCGGCMRRSDPAHACTMPHSLRIDTFAAYARRHGEEALLAHLSRKASEGVLYHRNGLLGDYDNFTTEEELLAFLEN